MPNRKNGRGRSTLNYFATLPYSNWFCFVLADSADRDFVIFKTGHASSWLYVYMLLGRPTSNDSQQVLCMFYLRFVNNLPAPRQKYIR